MQDTTPGYAARVRRWVWQRANISQGSGESGKSTIVKQMKIIHQNGYTNDELALYRLTIYKNLIDCAKTLVGAMRQFGIEPTSPANVEYSDFLMGFVLGPDPQTPLDMKVGLAVTNLWADGSIEALMERQSEFYMMDSAP
jgi:guanine nucleotide-binding protein subunit alpha